jgi:aspartyl-tRNA(Asn)/glutamyl-tRNA(Gln) amidotransferase subunit A
MSDRFGCFVGAPVLQAGRPGALVVAVKDNIDMAGLPTRAGFGGPGVVAAADAPVVRRLREAGFGLLGKAKMNEGAFGGTGDNPHDGRTENPVLPGHSPGGSSSGSAAAIAAGLCGAALGTDTLGSVRIPAAYCGLVGLKPSFGLLPLDGVVPLSWTLDHVGIMGATVAAVAEVLAVFAPRPAPPDGLRVGVPDALPGVEAETLAVCHAALRNTGWQAQSCTIEGSDLAATRRAGLLVIEAEAAVIHAALLGSDDPAMSEDLRRMLRYGRDCGSGRLVRALRVLREAAAWLDRALQEYDLIALPTVPSPAYAWTDGAPANQGELTALANAGGHPAVSVPVGAGADGRPIGLQLVGRRGADWLVLDAAAQVSAVSSPARSGHQPST